MKILKFSLLTLLLAVCFVSCEKEDATNPQEDKANAIAEMENLFETRSNNEEEPGDPRPIDCSVFDGVNEFKFFGFTFAGVKTLSIRDIDHSNIDAVKWTIDGERVTPRTGRILLLNEHLTQAATVEVCYSASSPACGVLEDCATINFVPKN